MRGCCSSPWSLLPRSGRRRLPAARSPPSAPTGAGWWRSRPRRSPRPSSSGARRSRLAGDVATAAEAALVGIDDELDYVRVRTPAVPGDPRRRHASANLRTLSRMRPILLLAVSETCGALYAGHRSGARVAHASSRGRCAPAVSRAARREQTHRTRASAVAARPRRLRARLDRRLALRRPRCCSVPTGCSPAVPRPAEPSRRSSLTSTRACTASARRDICRRDELPARQRVGLERTAR